ncbi:photosystem I assembly factor PSA3, chloroplastic-like [Mangifera indica]|uniref:photosystem I assembly factor PSA3, chloroplastic-like n=1 Tax=Mangifera indica TaxID=29780 RepID=UPI001CFB9B38|nr:photosystem I assembly factor PSA3, chloroplastic-like [Mangifera indica]
MVVTSFTLTCLSSCNQISSSLHVFRPIHSNPKSNKVANFYSSSGVFSVKAYYENQNSISGFANKVIGSLPVIGLLARILSDEGGVGSDTVDFAEFRRRVGNNCGINDSKAFYDFQERRGRAGDPLYVLMCCWVAAVGAGLLKSEEILEGATRLRISNDLEFEEQNFIALMNEAKERRSKFNVAIPSIAMEVRAEKALEAVYVCCFRREAIEEEDKRLLITMLSAVFPSVKPAEIERIVKDRARKVAEGSDENGFPEPKPLPEEAVKLQMKDLQFLQQNRDT